MDLSDVLKLGHHLLVEYYDCENEILNNPSSIEECMTQAAIECGATIVQKNFHLFNPYGVSGVVVLAESHLAIHTWPEYHYAAVDLFTCGERCNPIAAFHYLKKILKAKESHYTELNRGLLQKKTNTLMKVPPIFLSDQSLCEDIIPFNESAEGEC
ncbi:MAG: adenosylmethionine decarboxylase [Waddliaceae bacterium]